MSIERIPFAIEQTGDRQTMAMQQAAKRVAVGLDRRGAPPLVTGVFTFTAGASVVINHGLGRVPTEWAVTDVVDGYPSFKRTSWDARTIVLQSLNACSARFRVA